MYANPEQFAAAGKAGFENFINVANASMTGFEKLVALNVSSVKSMFDDAASNARVVLDARDPKAFLAQGASAAQPALEKSLAWSKEAYAIMTGTQATLRAAVEEQSASAQHDFAAILEKSLKNAPPGSESAVAALRSAVSGATSAYDNATRVAKQAFETAEANFNDVANRAAANVSTVAKAAGKRK